MCGIAAYIGKGNAFDFISQALIKMEYRGYDSYGIRIGAEEYKVLGAPSDTMPDFIEGNIGIGHTRWATHGEVSIKNCHPVTYMGCHVVHNGTVENLELHKTRQRGNYTTDTDTEVIACELFRNIQTSVDTLDEVGSFIAMLDSVSGLVVHRGSSPLYYQDGKIASDLRAFEGKVYVIPKNTHLLINEKFKVPKDWRSVDVNEEKEQNIKCYMKHEIFSQSEIIKHLKLTETRIPKTRVKLVACGSSYYAAMMAAYFMNTQATYDATAVYATEFVFTGHEDAIIFISQSGETKDVIDALSSVINSSKSWKSYLTGRHEQLPIYILQNKKESTLSQFCDYCKTIDIGAGLEIGVAATKTFTATVLQLCSIAGLEVDLNSISFSVKNAKQTDTLARIINMYDNVLILGSGEFYPIALEGALKLKEVAYIHAEAMPADEIKHGPIALIDGGTISIVIGDIDNKIENNVKQIESRGGRVIRLDGGLWETLVELQHLSCEVALLRGLNPDKPRNLAKTVTV